MISLNYSTSFKRLNTPANKSARTHTHLQKAPLSDITKSFSSSHFVTMWHWHICLFCLTGLVIVLSLGCMFSLTLLPFSACCGEMLWWKHGYSILLFIFFIYIFFIPVNNVMLFVINLYYLYSGHVSALGDRVSMVTRQKSIAIKIDTGTYIYIAMSKLLWRLTWSSWKWNKSDRNSHPFTSPSRLQLLSCTILS